MTSQCQCIRQNIGIWHGSFTQFLPDGGVVLNKSEYEAHSGRFTVVALSKSCPSQTTHCQSQRFLRNYFFSKGISLIS